MKNLLLSMCLLAIAFVNAKAEITWPETVNEWGLEGVTSVAAGEIVYYNNAFYQSTAEIAVGEGKEPEVATDNFTKVADSRIWEIGMSHINFEEYVIYKGFVYQCTAADGTDAWSSGWNPTEWEAPNYQEICGIVLINNPWGDEEEPGIEEGLPENYVGYWTDDFSWLPGFHAIYNEKVFPCIAATHAEGGEHPETTWGYWGETIGDEANLLSLEGVTIPEWDDTRIWPAGAIVSYNEKYHKCLAATHIDGGEHPETTWGYWEVLNLTTGLNNLTNNGIAYAILDGQLFFANNPSKLHVQIYNVIGQQISESSQNGIELPYSGIFIVKAVVDGKSVSFKIVR